MRDWTTDIDNNASELTQLRSQLAELKICGAKTELANGEYVSPCRLERGHKGQHEGSCLGSTCVWSDINPLEYEQMQYRLSELQQERDELLALFDMQHKRSKEADLLWQTATGKHGTIPDLGCLLEWLMNERQELQQECERKDGLLNLAYKHTLDECLRNRNRAAGIPQETGVRLTPEEQRQLGRDLAEHWHSTQSALSTTKE